MTSYWCEIKICNEVFRTAPPLCMDTSYGMEQNYPVTFSRQGSGAGIIVDILQERFPEMRRNAEHFRNKITIVPPHKKKQKKRHTRPHPPTSTASS